MSRSRLAALVRVAELQEAVARGAAGRALQQARAAEQAEQQAHALLERTGLAGGTRTALESSTQLRLWRAQEVGAAEAQTRAAAAARQDAVAGWTAARRRHRLFDELAARAQESERVAQERRAQRLADDLAASRPGPARWA